MQRVCPLLAAASLSLWLLLPPGGRAQGVPGSSGTAGAETTRRMFVEPSSTTVALGKAGLTVSPLSRKEKFYVGNYQIKVTPYFFKNEKGVLLLGNGEDLLAKLAAGTAVAFSGKATNSKDGEVKAVSGKATPSASDRGAVSFTVLTNNGPVAFQTTYRLGP